MKALGAQVRALELVAQNRAPADDLEHHVNALAATSAQVLSAFEPAAAGGNAKPDVWNNWDDFARRATEQAEGLTRLQRALAAGETTAAGVRDALLCQQCHATYRREMADGTQDATGDGNQAVTDYRRYLMQAIDAQTAALGQILAWMVADDHFATHLDVIAINARMAVGAFEQAVPGGDALPRIWTHRKDFAARMNALTEGVMNAARVAREEGKDAALGPVMDALTCKRCHDLYREGD